MASSARRQRSASRSGFTSSSLAVWSLIIFHETPGARRVPRRKTWYAVVRSLDRRCIVMSRDDPFELLCLSSRRAGRGALVPSTEVVIPGRQHGLGLDPVETALTVGAAHHEPRVREHDDVTPDLVAREREELAHASRAELALAQEDQDLASRGIGEQATRSRAQAGSFRESMVSRRPTSSSSEKDAVVSESFCSLIELPAARSSRDGANVPESAPSKPPPAEILAVG